MNLNKIMNTEQEMNEIFSKESPGRVLLRIIIRTQYDHMSLSFS